MITDPLMWSPVSLGRWFGTQVRINIILIAFVLFKLAHAALAEDTAFLPTVCWLALLMAALAIHELAHAVAASLNGAEADEVRLWPLGNMVGPAVAARSTDNLGVILAGPVANAAMVVTTALGLAFAGAQFVWDPCGNPIDSGAPLTDHGKHLAPPLSPLWWIGWFGYLNYVLLIANLIPALPFDGGRVLRSVLANSSVAQAKDGLYSLLTAHAFAGVLAVAGLIRLISGRSDGSVLIFLAILIELIVRSEARMLDDGGFFEDGVFGYDFSEGYTSLEGSAAKVRPYYRESALKRWRRRRSELRRQRRQAREAAEERRMDEILEKLHREGRHSLSDEEHRFLIRVSAKYRNRPRARD
jgi:Zn-dependent protease